MKPSSRLRTLASPNPPAHGAHHTPGVRPLASDARMKPMERSDPSLIETVAHPVAVSTPSSISSSSRFEDEGRFIAGTLLAGRYRILGLLGRGGMGEVYRATDLMIGQSVALKFLPEEAARDQRLLERFHGEVRVARQVSHPNVCRVYDIGQIDGMPFISMEYVDGEDLSSLLLRIGRLPADKALETARKLCAGLAAAHDRGVIHRDLKPQNIMINKRGEVVIMDFGLAAVAAQLTGQESRNGTPAYMSPEQLKGAEVTQRSDIYALGLVLYELFTGKRPYDARNVRQLIDLQESADLTSMTSIAADVDHSVEKVVRRCLDPDPARRPASPLSVAAALPGGDPLAEALAAGEMPSPELVAASGKVEGLDRKYSVPLLIVAIACLIVSLPVRSRSAAVMHAPLDIPPDALQHKAREFASTFGYTRKPADTARWIDKRYQVIDSMGKLPEPRKWQEWLASESPIYVGVRESPAVMVAKPDGVISEQNPPPTVPGMLQMKIDGAGRLLSFEAVPLDDEGTSSVDAEAVFRAAGLDYAKFTPGPPKKANRLAYDRVEAWTAPHAVLPNVNVDVQIAWLKGRVTQARIDPMFPGGNTLRDDGKQSWFIQLFVSIALASAVFFGIVLARRNWLKNRADRKGAFKLACLSLILVAVDWVGKVHGVAASDMIGLFFSAAGDWLLRALNMWLLYIALEPAVRARWPHSIVSWNRLLAGNWLDAQVGSHVLIGAAVGGALWNAVMFIDVVIRPANTLDAGMNLWLAESTRHFLSAIATQIAASLFIGLVGFFTIFGLRVLLRKDIAAAIAASLLFTVTRPGIFNEQDHLLVLLGIWIVLYASLIFTLLRFGLVATISAVFFLDNYQYLNVGTEHTAWFSAPSAACLLLLAGIAVFAFWRSLGSRELIGGDAAT